MAGRWLLCDWSPIGKRQGAAALQDASAQLGDSLAILSPFDFRIA